MQKEFSTYVTSSHDVSNLVYRFDSRQKYKRNSNKRLREKSGTRLRGLQADTFVQVTFASLRVRYPGSWPGEIH